MIPLLLLKTYYSISYYDWSLLSKQNLIIASLIFNVIRGPKIYKQYITNQTIPYSSGSKTPVYKGTSKKTTILDPKLPNAKRKVFFIRYFILPIFSLPFFINQFQKKYVRNYITFVFYHVDYQKK